jgi:uncharacterized protein (DUF433 family)
MLGDMLLMRMTAGYTLSDLKRNWEFMTELQISQIIQFTEKYTRKDLKRNEEFMTEIQIS